MSPRGRGIKVGVVAMITPWNWPMYQIVLKVIPALAVGCTAVLKPSEIAPLSAHLFTEFIHDAGFPPVCFFHVCTVPRVLFCLNLIVVCQKSVWSIPLFLWANRVFLI